MTNLRQVDQAGLSKGVKYSSLRATILVSIACIIAPISFAQDSHQDIEFLGMLQSFMFNQHYDNNPGFGAETQIRIWPMNNLGFAFASGISFFYVDKVTATSSQSVATKEGSLLFFPIGGSILLSTNPNQNPKFIFESGVRYVFVKSDLEEVITTTDSGTVTIDKFEYDIGNGVLGLVSIYAVTELSPALSLSFGLGYQFDITKGKEVILDFSGEHELSSLLIRAGLLTNF